MIDKQKHGFTIQVDEDGTEWIKGVQITSWDTSNVPRHNGIWIKGVGGNPAGMPKVDDNKRKAVMQKCLGFSEEGVDILIAMARNKREKSPTRIKAIEVIFERGLGRPQEQKEEQLTPEELVKVLPSIFFPGGVKTDV